MSTTITYLAGSHPNQSNFQNIFSFLSHSSRPGIVFGDWQLPSGWMASSTCMHHLAFGICHLAAWMAVWQCSPWMQHLVFGIWYSAFAIWHCSERLALQRLALQHCSINLTLHRAALHHLCHTRHLFGFGVELQMILWSDWVLQQNFKKWAFLLAAVPASL